MKLAAFLLITALHVGAKGLPQEKITLSEKNASLPYILQQINKQTGYQYFFVEQWASEANKIDIDVSNASLETVLKICFKNQPFTYEIVRRTIVIKKKVDKEKAILPPPLPLYIDIHGRAFDETEKPIAGVTVTVKNTKRATSTNEEGEFSLTTVNADAKLEFTGANIETAELLVNGQTEHTIKLIKKVNGLDEVQVIAYGTTTQRLNTGNVSTVKASDIEKQPVNNPLLALQGRVPGLDISMLNSLPGGVLKILIRGQNSISHASDPLFIIDGVPYISQTLTGVDGGYISGDGRTGNPFSFINPADIESIDVLKDADATAIYGSRGANGVILVTTKKGKSGQTRINANVQSGWGKVSRMLKLLDRRQYLDMRYEAFKNDHASPNPNSDYDLTAWDTTRSTDWRKALIGGTSKYTDIQFSISGGNSNTQYLIASGYHKETTVFPGDFNDQKSSVHVNINSSSPDKRFKVSFSGLYSADNNKLGAFNFTLFATQLPPDAPVLLNPDGSLNWAPNAFGKSTWPNRNPLAGVASKYYTRTNNLVANGNLSYELLPRLEIKSSFGYTNMQTNQLQTVPFVSLDPSTLATSQRSSDFGNNNVQSWIIEPQITYLFDMGKSRVNLLAGTTISQNSNNGQVLTANGFSSDLLMEDIKSATSIIPIFSTISSSKYNAGFARINYNYDDRYLLNLTARRDGSSRFGPANRFHDFWAVGAGWIFSKEDFVEDRFHFLSYGKLRGSYGSTGNDQVGDYSYLDLYSTVAGIGVPYQGANGITPNTIFNPNLAWEETRKLEVGLELGFLKDKIVLVNSFYRNRSSNQLLAYALPAITGFTSIQRNLPALVQNMGLEFELRTVNINHKKFRWTSSFNISLNRNVLLSVGKGNSANLMRSVGHPLGGQFVYHFLGVEPISGVDQFSDSHGHPTYNPNINTDQTVYRDLTKKYYGGLQNTFTYKSFQLDVLFQFVKQPGITYLYSAIPGAEGVNQPITVLDHWKNPGDIRPLQRLSQNYDLVTMTGFAQFSDQSYGDASFIRLKNLSLSCQLPKIGKQKPLFQNARVYLQAQNLFILTKYKGSDPETQSSANSLPPLRMIAMGLQVTL